MPCDAVIALQLDLEQKHSVFLFQYVPCQGFSVHKKDVNIRLRCTGL